MIAVTGNHKLEPVSHTRTAVGCNKVMETFFLNKTTQCDNIRTIQTELVKIIPAERAHGLIDTIEYQTWIPVTVFTFEDAGNYIRDDYHPFDGAIVSYDPDTGVFAGINGVPTNSTVTLNFSALGGNFSDITVDFAESSNYDKKGTSTIGADKGALDANGTGAGRRVGEMIGLTVQDNGMIYATYDSGMTRLLGQIATALFANASGLEKNGDNLYSATLNSGEFDGIGVDITADGGYMTTGQLEMSNVDLSSEFTEMITTQRGFQANSRIITVSDTLLEELTNLKR